MIINKSLGCVLEYLVEHLTQLPIVPLEVLHCLDVHLMQLHYTLSTATALAIALLRLLICSGTNVRVASESVRCLGEVGRGVECGKKAT